MIYFVRINIKNLSQIICSIFVQIIAFTAINLGYYDDVFDISITSISIADICRSLFRNELVVTLIISGFLFLIVRGYLLQYKCEKDAHDIFHQLGISYNILILIFSIKCFVQTAIAAVVSYLLIYWLNNIWGRTCNIWHILFVLFYTILILGSAFIALIFWRCKND